MDVWMMEQVLTPRVKDTEEADSLPEACYFSDWLVISRRVAELAENSRL